MWTAIHKCQRYWILWILIINCTYSNTAQIWKSLSTIEYRVFKSARHIVRHIGYRPPYWIGLTKCSYPVFQAYIEHMKTWLFLSRKFYLSINTTIYTTFHGFFSPLQWETKPRSCILITWKENPRKSLLQLRIAFPAEILDHPVTPRTGSSVRDEIHGNARRFAGSPTTSTKSR